MDLGFEKQLHQILELIKIKDAPCQVVLASATKNTKVSEFGQSLLGDHVIIDGQKLAVKEVRGGKEEGVLQKEVCVCICVH